MISRASLHPQTFLPAPTHSLLGITLTHFSQNGCANPSSVLLCIFEQQRSLPHCKSLHSSSFRGISLLIRLRLWAANEGKSKGISFLWPFSIVRLSAKDSGAIARSGSGAAIGRLHSWKSRLASGRTRTVKWRETVGPDRRWAVAD